MAGHGGARRNAGRKRGIGLTHDIKRHCQNFIEEILKDEAIRLKATKQLSLHYEDESEDYLYIIYLDGKYKIGFSSNWKKRKKSYETHSPYFKLIYLVKSFSSFDLERELHIMFESKREKGEWFNLSDKDLIKAISYCSSRIN